MSSPLRQRNFALLWGGGLISMIGDRALLTALPFYVYQQTHSTLAAAGLFVAMYLPQLLFSTMAGVFVDRWDRRRLMIATNLIQATIALLLLLVRSNEWLWLVYLLFFANTTVALFFALAEDALLPHLVPETQLFAANALNALNNNLARLLGPPIGGLLLSYAGLSSIAILNSLSFLVAAVCILMITASPRPQAQAAATSSSPALAQLWHEWRDGLGLLWRHRLIGTLVLIAGLTSFGGAMFDPLVAPWVEAVLDQSAATLGLISTAGAIGGILASACLSRWRLPYSAASIVGVSGILSGLVLLLIYNLTALPLILVVSLLARFPLISFSTAFQTLIQTTVPDDYRGRISGAFATVNALLGMVGLGLAGVLGERLGIVTMLSAGSILTLFAGAVALLLLRPAPARTPAPAEAAA